MKAQSSKLNWSESIKPLLKKYKGKPHPLIYKNFYELIVLVILSAQTNDKLINNISPELFKAFPDMKSLAKADRELLFNYISKVVGFGKKADWLISLAQKLKTDKGIPQTFEALTALPGIGRKSANVIMREMGAKAAGVIVDLHVVRVASRIGIANGDDPKKIEKQIMDELPQKFWGEVGMAISFLGRETCRPANPIHAECVMNKVCRYYAATKKKGR